MKKFSLKSTRTAITCAVIGIILFVIYKIFVPDFNELTKRVADKKSVIEYSAKALYHSLLEEYEKAAENYLKAAELGHIPSQIKIAELYASGKGVAEDLQKSFEWYKKAAEQGDVHSQIILGRCYEEGKIVAKNLNEAAKWFYKAKEAARESSQINLARNSYDKVIKMGATPPIEIKDEERKIEASQFLKKSDPLTNEYYKNKSGNRYWIWVHEKPDEKSTLLVTTRRVIEVIEIQGNWAKVKIPPSNGGRIQNVEKVNSLKDKDGVIYGFVSVSTIVKTKKPRYLEDDYIAKSNNSAKNANANNISDLYEIHLSENVAKLTDILNLGLSKNVVVILTLIILGLTIGMHIMGRMWYEEGEFEGLQLPLFAVLFTAACILELIIAMSGENPIWFCSPSKIGWFYSIIGLFVFIYVINNQIKCFRLLMNELTSEYGYYSLRTKKYLTGILSGIIGFIVLCFYALMLFGQGDVPASKSVFWTIASVVAALQILQTVIIYNHLEKKKLLVSSIYLIGILATFVTLMYFMALIVVAIITVIIGVILFIFSKVQKSVRSSSSSYSGTAYSSTQSSDTIPGELCSSCMYYPGGYGRNCSHRTTGDSRQVNDNTSACSYWRRH